jgi:hypothetical protein
VSCALSAGALADGAVSVAPTGAVGVVDVEPQASIAAAVRETANNRTSLKRALPRNRRTPSYQAARIFQLKFRRCDNFRVKIR